MRMVVDAIDVQERDTIVYVGRVVDITVAPDAVTIKVYGARSETYTLGHDEPVWIDREGAA